MQTEQRQPQAWTRAFGTFVGFVTLFAAVAAGSVFVRAGWEKLDDPVWTGEQAGVVITGFMQGTKFKATKSERNPYPDVLAPMRAFNERVVAKHSSLFSWLVVWGELVTLLAVLALCCVRFRGSRALLVAMASLATSMNLVYLHQGSSGSNPAMLLMWLTVIWVAATMPRGTRLRHRPPPDWPPSRDGALCIDRTVGVFVGTVLTVLAVESVWITSVRETVLCATFAGGLAAALAFVNARVSAWASGRHNTRLGHEGGLQTA